MKKKLSLLLVMIMALIMVLGTGITAMAAPAVNRCNSSDCNDEMVCVIGWDNDGWVEAYKYDRYGNYTGKGSIDPGWFADVPVAGKVYHDLSSYDHTGRTYAFALCPENDSNFDLLPAEVEVCEDQDGTTLAYVIEVYQALDGKKYAHVKDYFCNNGEPTPYVAYPLYVDYFADEPIAGRVYHTKDNKYYLCDANAPAPTPTPEPLVVAECEDSTNQSFDHFYSFEVLDSQGEVCGDLYRVNGGVVEIYHTSYPPTAFVNGVYVKGWYCANLDWKWATCNGPHGITPVNPYASAPQSTASAPSCDHDFQWQTITSATATTYGTEGEVCSKCGATRNVRTKSPLDDWVRMQINNAKPGDVLKFDFGPWNSYPLWMMQMIADKPTVTYIFNYTYQGNKYEVTIKPGDKFALDCDWYGPLKMPTLFDTVITKW